MSLFSKQLAYCRMCAKPVLVDAGWLYSKHGCCTKKCLAELEWRYTLSIMSQDYKEDPKQIKPEEDYSLI